MMTSKLVKSGVFNMSKAAGLKVSIYGPPDGYGGKRVVWEHSVLLNNHRSNSNSNSKRTRRCRKRTHKTDREHSMGASYDLMKTVIKYIDQEEKKSCEYDNNNNNNKNNNDDHKKNKSEKKKNIIDTKDQLKPP